MQGRRDSFEGCFKPVDLLQIWKNANSLFVTGLSVEFSCSVTPDLTDLRRFVKSLHA